VVSLDAHSVEDILQSIRQVGAAAGAPAPAERLVAGLSARLDRVRRAVAGRDCPRVLAIEWLDPPFVPGHWVPQMIAIAGGICLAGETGRPSREASWDELAGLDPDVLIVMPCGYGLERSRQEAQGYAQRLTQVAPRALASGRAYVVDGSSYFNRSGPRVVDGIEILAALLHADRAPQVDLTGKAEPLTQRTAHSGQRTTDN
jgi:iron complex transport system substrate-binding protein